MKITTDYHIHSTFCDGLDTVTKMLRGAEAIGYTGMGFSSHAPSAIPSDWRMTLANEEAYRKTVRELQKTETKVEILLGTETDPESCIDPRLYDYRIASVHDVIVDGQIVETDGPFELIENAVSRWFGGDWNQYAAAYFERLRNFPRSLLPTFVGHFDLLTKYEEKHPRFRCEYEKYYHNALDTMDALASTIGILEINTGVMTRGGRSTPYPAKEFLSYWREIGGRIIICSDAHAVENLGGCFDTAVHLARDCGYRYAVKLHRGQNCVPAVEEYELQT